MAASGPVREERKAVNETQVTREPGGDEARLRYGILGGTFDPPHLGHLVLAQEALIHLRLERVWFVPTGAPPHKPNRQVSSHDDRRAMVERAIAGNPRFALSAIELERSGPSYSVDTLAQLRREWGESVSMSFIMGWDMLTYLPQWRQPEQVIATLDRIVATHRPGFIADPEEIAQLERAFPGLSGKLAILAAPQVDVSSTEIRHRVASGVPIRYLVSDSVRSYIEEHGLYRSDNLSESGGADL